nr:MAG TPA: hypothetical protein [Bacteriophage sp.]
MPIWDKGILVAFLAIQQKCCSCSIHDIGVLKALLGSACVMLFADLS